MTQKNDSFQAQTREDFFSSAIKILPIVVFASYLYAFCYEIGYSLYFGYPISWISIDLAIFGNFFMDNVFTFIMLLLYLQINLQYWPATQKYAIAVVTGAMVLIVLCLIAQAFDPIYWSIPIVFNSIFAILGGRAYSRGKWKNSAESEFVPSVYDRRSNVPKGTVAEFTMSRLGFDPLLYVLIFLFVVPLLFVVSGFFKAGQQQVFLRFEIESRSFIVLRFSGDRAIASPLDVLSNERQVAFVNKPLDQVGLLVPMRIDKNGNLLQ